jgi:hypothetical protein
MKKFIFLILCCVVFVCCSKSSTYFYEPIKVYETFSFEKKRDTVYILPSTTEYILNATAEIGKDGLNKVVVETISDLNTAVYGKHYSNPIFLWEDHPEWLQFDFGNTSGEKREASVKILLFPENITKELQIAYRCYRSAAQKNYIDTIVITLIPVQ